jgi:hypothetical protein
MHSNMQLGVERHTWVSGVVGSTRTGGGTQAVEAVLAPAAGRRRDPQKTAGPAGKKSQEAEIYVVDKQDFDWELSCPLSCSV